MKKPSFSIPPALLCQHTELKPKLSNNKRWRSKYHILQRYCALRPIKRQIDYDKIEKLFLTEEEDDPFDRFFKRSACFESATLELLSDATSLSDARAVLDGVADKYHHLKHKFNDSATIVDNVKFEQTIIKMQRGYKKALYAAEQKALR